MSSEGVGEDCLAWAAQDASGVLSPYRFNRRALQSEDVYVKITHCGVCYADVIWAKNKHGDSKYPIVPGKLEMSVTENPKKTDAPPIVKLNKALKLAEVWVKNMSGSVDDETTNMDTEGRPQRLGLGAKVSRQSNVGLSDDPVERRLHSKLEAAKRKAANIAKDEGTNSCGIDDDDEDNEDESRTNAFAKRKAPAPVTLSIPGNKKQK